MARDRPHLLPYEWIGRFVVAFSGLEASLHRLAWLAINPAHPDTARTATASLPLEQLLGLLRELADGEHLPVPLADLDELLEAARALSAERDRVVHALLVDPQPSLLPDATPSGVISDEDLIPFTEERLRELTRATRQAAQLALRLATLTAARRRQPPLPPT